MKNQVPLVGIEPQVDDITIVKEKRERRKGIGGGGQSEPHRRPFTMERNYIVPWFYNHCPDNIKLKNISECRNDAV